MVAAKLRALDGKAAHTELVTLAKEKSGRDFLEGRLMLLVHRTAFWVELGFGSFYEYAERILGYHPKVTSERLRVAHALEELPELAGALSEGRVHWSVVRELTRIVTRDTEKAWLGAVANRTVRQVEEMVAGRRVGDLPSDPADPGLRKRRIVLEVSPETYALWRDMESRVRAETGEGMSQDDMAQAIARRVLGGPADSGRASYQIGIMKCHDCGRAWQRGGGELIEVGSDALEVAECDAQSVEMVDPETGAPHVGKAAQDIPPATRRHVMLRDQGRCAVPGCRNTLDVQVHHLKLRSEGGTHDPDTLIVLCSTHHRAQHRGQLLIDGTSVAAGLRFLHADGTPYGGNVTPEAAQMAVDVFQALRQMGFRESESKQAVAALGPHVGNMGLAMAVREALRVLRGEEVARPQ